ncbi:MAG TPA: histidine phosphatase family protein [Acidimicrobiales bacterium]|jgi:probable phosphoglycerate mutase|nr:histidine phosphatase family protein [Acidimicrobiales bacterium]
MARAVTRILLIRHGQSEWNLTGRWQGQTDPPLTDLGRSQAMAAARSLGTVSAIWSSDLQRATVTAMIISNELGVGPVVLEPDLRERDAGEWQGLTRDEIDEQFPGYLEPPEGTSGEGWVPRRPPGWESDDDLAVRVRRVLVRIRDEVGEGEVLVVAHAGVLYLVERALGADGLRLANLEGRWIDVLEGDGGDREGTSGDLAGIARLGERVMLLAPDQITVPGQI